MKDISLNKVDDGLGESGIGYVVIPAGIEDVEKFKEDCRRNLTVSIVPGFGCSTYNCVPCTIESFQNIRFPDDSDERGTPVAWVKDSFLGTLFIVGTLNRESDYSGIGEEQFRICRSVGLNNVEVFLDGKNSALSINVLGESSPSKLDIKISSKNEDSVFNISSDNELNILSDKNINIKSGLSSRITINKDTKDRAVFQMDEQNISLSLSDEKEKLKFKLQYESEEGFEYLDEFENEVKIIKEKVTLKTKEVNLDSKKVNLGNGKEKMVKGETLESILNELIDAISQITVTTPTGPSIPPLLNIAQFTVIKSKLKTFLSNVSNTE